MFSDVYFLVLELITPGNAYPEVSNELRCLLNSQVRNPVEVCTEHKRDKSELQRVRHGVQSVNKACNDRGDEDTYSKTGEEVGPRETHGVVRFGCPRTLPELVEYTENNEPGAATK